MSAPHDSADDPAATDESDQDSHEDTQLDNIFGMLSVKADLADDGLVTSSDTEPAAPEDLWFAGDDSNNILTGEGGDDSLIGNAGDDMLCGHAGDDWLEGGEGADGLNGGEGADLLLGGVGDDTLHGDSGNDSLYGGAGNDRLEGCEGDDSLFGGDGNDTLVAGDGNDALYGEAGADDLIGGHEDDALFGGTGQDNLDGGSGNDTLWGQDDHSDDRTTDFLNGGAGDDVLHLGAGDYGNGGDGADSFALQNIGPDDAPIQIVDFNAAEDHLIVLYDSALHPDPQLTSDTTEAGTTLMLDGVVVANLQSTQLLDLSTVELRAA
ncbi:MAG: calcium-binding protein [Cypionkella sp.]